MSILSLIITCPQEEVEKPYLRDCSELFATIIFIYLFLTKNTNKRTKGIILLTYSIHDYWINDWLGCVSRPWSEEQSAKASFHECRCVWNSCQRSSQHYDRRKHWLASRYGGGQHFSGDSYGYFYFISRRLDEFSSIWHFPCLVLISCWFCISFQKSKVEYQRFIVIE